MAGLVEIVSSYLMTYTFGTYYIAGMVLSFFLLAYGFKSGWGKGTFIMFSIIATYVMAVPISNAIPILPLPVIYVALLAIGLFLMSVLTQKVQGQGN